MKINPCQFIFYELTITNLTTWLGPLKLLEFSFCIFFIWEATSQPERGPYSAPSAAGFKRAASRWKGREGKEKNEGARKTGKWTGREEMQARGGKKMGEGRVASWLLVVWTPLAICWLHVVLYRRYGRVMREHNYTGPIYYFCKYTTSLVCNRRKVFHLWGDLRLTVDPIDFHLLTPSFCLYLPVYESLWLAIRYVVFPGIVDAWSRERRLRRGSSIRKTFWLLMFTVVRMSDIAQWYIKYTK